MQFNQPHHNYDEHHTVNIATIIEREKKTNRKMWLRFFWCENQKKCEKKSPFCWAILTMWMCICVCVPVFFFSRLVCRMCECLCMFVSAFFRLYSKHHIILWRSEKGLKFSKWFFSSCSFIYHSCAKKKCMSWFCAVDMSSFDFHDLNDIQLICCCVLLLFLCVIFPFYLFFFLCLSCLFQTRQPYPYQES